MSDVPVLIRRTTMLVNDIEPSLQIYRDILGMSVHYDEEIVVSGDGLPAGEPNSLTRLVMLKCKDDFIGMLGILQYIDPPLPEPPPRSNPNRVRIGESFTCSITRMLRRLRTTAGGTRYRDGV